MKMSVLLSNYIVILLEFTISLDVPSLCRATFMSKAE